MAINFIYDQKDDFANEIINETFNHFSYNYENYFSVDLGIPINLYGHQNDIPIAVDQSDLTVFLISNGIFSNSKKYIDEYKRLENTNNLLLAVSLCKCGHRLLDTVNVLIYPFCDESDSINNTKKETFILKVLCIIARKIINKKINIFLSYYREDGTKICTAIRKHLLEYPQYVEFMDVKEIDYSENIQKIIESTIQNSLMMCISTDKYSERFWCTREILKAKELDVPMIFVDCITNFENRRNPNAANVPVVRFKKNVSELTVAYALLMLMKEYLKKKTFKKPNLFSDNAYFLWKAPEPSKLAEVKKNYPSVKKIVYPAPPITLCETEYYNNIFEDYELVLDNNLQQIANLANTKKICLSVSDYQTERKLHNNFLNCLVKEIIRYLIYGDYIIQYGGDWRQNGYTQLIVDYLHAYKNQYVNCNSPFINYYANIEQKSIGEIKHNVFPCDAEIFDLEKAVETQDSVGLTLTKMRQRMIKDADIVIAVSGRYKSSNGFISGVAEEVALAIEYNKPLYLIGAPGGATRKIIDILFGKKYEFITCQDTSIAKKTCKYVNTTLHKLTINELININKLTQEENMKLFYSSDIKIVINTLFNGILRLC